MVAGSWLWAQRSRSEGVAMPPFFSSCGCYWNFVKAYNVSHETEGNEGSKLIFFLIIFVSSTKLNNKKVLPVQHSGENTGFAFRWAWV